MATYTATFYSQTPKGIHAGINRINVSWNSGALTASNGDVILLAKLPNGSRLVDFWEDHSTGAATATMDLGLANGTGTGGGASFSCYQSGGAQAAKNRYAIRSQPEPVSTSDSDPNKYGILAAKLIAVSSATGSFILNVCFTYTVDDLIPTG